MEISVKTQPLRPVAPAHMVQFDGLEKPLNDLKRFFPYSGGSPERASAVDYANPANAVTRSA